MDPNTDSTDIQDEIEITAELNPLEIAAEWESLANRAKLIHPVIRIAARTDLGRIRENNEDKFDFFEVDDPVLSARKGSFYAVADGMGGHAAGQIASEMALKTVVKSYYKDESADVVGSLRRAIAEANSLICDAAQMITERKGMGTTLVSVVIRADTAYFAHVGDSRAYIVRNHSIRQITEDHSWVAEQVRRGAMTLHEAERSPFRNVITRSLGNMPTVESDIHAETIEAGDTIILCSDGLSGHLSAKDMLCTTDSRNPAQAAMDLVELANDRGGQDNITVMIVVIEDILCDEGADELPAVSAVEVKPRKRRFFGLLR